MRNMWLGPLTVLALAALLAIGCAGRSGDDQGAPPLSMFADVPLPPELDIDEKNSQVYEHAIGRVGLLKASGRIEKLAVLSYYREAMLQNGWTKESEFDNGDRHMLIFAKSPRSAAVTVKEGWFSTDVEINVSAKKP